MLKSLLFSAAWLLLITVVSPSVQAHGKHKAVRDAEEHFITHIAQSIPGSFELAESGWVGNVKQDETRRNLELPVSHPYKS